ncbi:MAG: hypothetical protein ACLSUW_01735 [Akkermansia sp.]
MRLRRKLAALGFYETQTIKLIASESADGSIAQVKDASAGASPSGRRHHPRGPSAQRRPFRPAPGSHPA